jgi:hypothetical protein
MQEPAAQVIPLVQAWPQPPQFALSVLTSVLQWKIGPGPHAIHGVTHSIWH